MASVTFAHVNKVYAGGVQALHDFSLHVADGEFLVLVGPSGSGKTTTLRLLAGLETPSSGTIAIADRFVHDLPPYERNVALVFQRHTLYPHLSVRRNLCFSMDLRQSWRRRWLGWRQRSPGEEARHRSERVTEAVQFLQLDNLLERQPAQLSGGQQQRVALGRALVRRPAVLLLDEPLSHLDAPLRLELRRQLHLLHKRFPATIIYVTHDPVEAMILADRVVVLDGGVVQQVDRPLTVYHKPCNRFVAGFFGWPAMNLLDGTLTVVEDELRLVTPEAVLPLEGAMPPAWRGHLGQAVTLGIRPQDVHWTTELSRHTLPMTVVAVEALGSLTLTTVQCGRLRLTVQHRSGLTIGEGQQLGVALETQHLHLFDGTTGRTVANDLPDG